ncbi:endonuclease/exonuclease/phosphatase family protein [Maribellus sp. YY47]|uniref:endonuclease/exonuclease/phosphatase family protein n=1 Tax=Maribellus sp. YY47 TaxID=2929486 RepID=UPI0020010589|nr:endonuclease/exonuclease/phosphatase family protein [Maribellus sp. YY47]MCK3685992.1 endonuclease/exonuclease/phosphatase family protein [Maribellus sp. YY47]
MKISLFILFIFFNIFRTSAQDSKQFAVVFYNAENLFDWKNDSLTNDDEFTPEGERHWTYSRFRKKIQNTSKVLLAAGQWSAPSIIGLCEVENRFVLDQLLTNTALTSIPYKAIHKESPDPRGIDVTLLYNPADFYPLGYNYYPLINKDGLVQKTREILYVSGILGGTDTLHIFVNHWPSRYGGLMETRNSRKLAAETLKTEALKILESNPFAKIVIVGDFNDQPNDESLHYFGAQNLEGEPVNNLFYNLSSSWMSHDSGTLKYQSQWFVFDQIVVSGALLHSKEGLVTGPENASIVKLSFLLEDDERYGGQKPFRTYNGFHYSGGFGDHLPVRLVITAN